MMPPHDDDDALDVLERGSSLAAKLESLRGGSGGQEKAASPSAGKAKAEATAKGKAAKATVIKPA